MMQHCVETLAEKAQYCSSIVLQTKNHQDLDGQLYPRSISFPFIKPL